jgi:hypothetical protein
MAAPIFHSYFFPDDLSSLQPVSVCFLWLLISTLLTQSFQGDLTLLQKPFCFTGYLAVGPQPVLYALYVSIICIPSEFLVSHHGLQCSDTRLEAVGGSFCGRHILIFL